MAIVSGLIRNPLSDGRQSLQAMTIRRGVQRMLYELGASVLPEMPLANGRRADLVAITRNGDFWIIEIKSSLNDFRTDRKWAEYRQFSDRLFFATHPRLDAAVFPADCGFILSDGYGAEILREAPEHRLAPARRKALTTRFARTAADRLLLAELAGASTEPIEGEML